MREDLSFRLTDSRQGVMSSKSSPLNQAFGRYWLITRSNTGWLNSTGPRLASGAGSAIASVQFRAQCAKKPSGNGHGGQTGPARQNETT